MDGISHVPRTVDEIFSDFRGRRAGLIKALTIEVGRLFQQCDPEKVNLCLYGLPNETWEVSLPAEMVPPDLPKPTLGISFARDGMQEEDWLSLVALQSDSWLHSVAFYFGGGLGFCKSERKRLFQMIYDLPTVFEVVTGTGKQSKDQYAAQNNSSESKSGGNMGSTLSGACCYLSGRDEFLICCGTCKRWFHAKCIEITPAQAEQIEQCKFSLSIKKARWDCSDYLRLIFSFLFILISVFQCGMSYGKKQ